MDPRLNIINNRLVNVKKIIAVSGGKGGIGKSVTASTLALSLAKHGYRVGLMDLDFCGPSDHVILGVEGVSPEEDQGIIPPEVYGIKLMSIIYYSGSSPAPLRGGEVSNAIIEMLAITLWKSLDFLIMDLPPGIGDPILDIIRLIEKVEFLVVTTPSRLARAVVKKELQVLREQGLPIIGVLENMKLSEQTSVWEEVGQYGAPVLGSVNFDDHLEGTLGDAGKLLKTNFARQLERIIFKKSGPHVAGADSLTRIIDGEPHIFRRLRGYVPHPIPVPCREATPVVLGLGGEHKNRFCLLKKDQAFLSPYIGAVDSLEGEKNLLASLHHFKKLIGVHPEVVAYDAHPGYNSAQVARRIPAQAYVEVQHHHAHLAGCLAENGLENEEVIGVILDGTGYGTDGHLWGFEILTGNYDGFKRRYHLAYVPLPGGEAAIRHPWRTAVAYLLTFLGKKGKEYARLIFKEKNLDILERMIETGFNAPLSSGCGRLFDAVSALLGICLENTYEGQAAIELGEAVVEPAADHDLQPYPYEVNEGIIWPGKLLAGIINDQLAGMPVEITSTKFHKTLVSIIGHVVGQVAAATGLKKVALSGGTWQNQYLFRSAKKFFCAHGYQVLYHRQVPANDSGIALGQVLIAQRRWRENVFRHTGPGGGA